MSGNSQDAPIDQRENLNADPPGEIPDPSLIIEVTAMELAAEELQRTVEEAQQYRASGNIHPRHLKLHIDALKEDTDMLRTLDTDDDVLRLQAAQLVYTARRTRRDLEKDLIDIQIEQSGSVASTAPPTEANSTLSKSSTLKLAPLHLPTFNGEVSQFRVYKNFFEENILQNVNLTDTTKWLRLRESLQGNPLELISEIPQSGETLQVAWKLLTETYGGEDRPIVELYNKLQQLPPSTISTEKLRITHSKLEGLLMSLQHLGHEVESNHFIRWTYLGKFPVEIIYQAQKTKDTPLTELRASIGQIIAARECTDQQRGPTQQRPNEFTRRSANSTTQAANDNTTKSVAPQRKPASFPKSLKCVFCEEEYWNDSCQKYKTVETRKQRLTGRCLRCLRFLHTGTPCVAEKRCFHCDSMEHNRALCPTKFGAVATQQKPQLATLAQSVESTGNFLTFLTRAQSPNSPHPIQIRVLIDTAGGSSVASQQLVTRLQLKITNEAEQYTGLNGAILTKGYKLQDDIQLIADDNSIVPIQAAMITGTIPEGPTANVEEFRRTNPQCDGIHIPPTGDGQPIDLLIGADMIIEILKADKITAINADTLLLPTKFGAIIVGRQRRHQRKVCHSHLFNFLTNPLQHISNLDVVGLTGITQSEIDDEDMAIRQFYETVAFLNNRYSISWPWRIYPPQLDTNFGMALGRLRSLYKQLQKSPQLLKDYHAIILRQLDEGIVEKVPKFESDSPVTHYLPHHPVLQPEKSTSLRPVYDGSAKSAKNKSLNDNIRKGTKWLTDLVTTLIRFRKHKNVVISDIARAFHQIGINEKDRDAARFLWLKNPELPPTNDNLQVYRFTRVAFGIIASPFLLHAVIRHHVSQYPDKKFSNIILQDLYADNLVSSLPAEVKPEEFYVYAKNFFGSMSMNLTKWATNIAELKEFIPNDDQLPDIIQNVLGIKWNTQDDEVFIKQPRNQATNKPTPRIVATEMARWFDPLGWASPITLLPKIFFRKIWDEVKQWDVELNQNYTEEWLQITSKLEEIKNIRLPRRYHTEQKIVRQDLQIFVDASATAYGIVVYLRSIADSKTEITLVASKTRLTPKKTVTIPKLELLAILLGCRFADYVRKALQLEKQIDAYIWTDSKCALSWMSQNKILPPILEKYISEAKQFGVKEYLYVPSEMNYADVASRGTDFSTLQKMQWWNGPEWLKKEETWPKNVSQPQIEPNLLLNFGASVTCKKKIILENEIQGIATLKIAEFSTLASLLRRTAFCFKALVKFRKNNFLKLQTELDVTLALQWWLYWDQNRCYAIKNEPDAGRKFNMNNITVFRDENGLIRCQTRIAHSEADVDTVNPVLLVKNSTLTKLIILDIHTKNMHTGTSHTLASVRKKFWLPHGRREIYKTIHQHCYRCRRYEAQPYPNPPAAPLPEFRITRTSQPFQATGIDVCGPFYTREVLGRGQPKLKRWVLLFTCAVIRAVHIEILTSMTSYEMLLAFRKFFARRGVPHTIISDNAPQFHVLDGCFKNIWKEFAQNDEVSAYFAKNQIIWKFVPELSPWMGGMYERLVQTIKRALDKTYGDIILLDRQFDTTMVEIEAIINSRPITYVDREADSPLLTPSDFLMARYTAIPMVDEYKVNEETLKKLWRSSQSYLNAFWKYWSDSYLLLLRDRNDQLKQRRCTTDKHPEKGDVVVMVDMSKKRSSWQIALVERLIKSHDEKIRAAQIKISNGTRLIRPITLLAPIKIQTDLPAVNDDQLNKNRTGLIHSIPDEIENFENVPAITDDVNNEEDS